MTRKFWNSLVAPGIGNPTIEGVHYKQDFYLHKESGKERPRIVMVEHEGPHEQTKPLFAHMETLDKKDFEAISFEEFKRRQREWMEETQAA